MRYPRFPGSLPPIADEILMNHLLQVRSSEDNSALCAICKNDADAEAIAARRCGNPECKRQWFCVAISFVPEHGTIAEYAERLKELYPGFTYIGGIAYSLGEPYLRGLCDIDL